MSNARRGRNHGEARTGIGDGGSPLVGLVLLALLAGCAAHHLAPPGVVSGERQSRYELRRIAREARGAGVEIEMSLWARRSGGRDLPGVEARTLLAAPNAFRMRVLSAFGTALDIAARGETLSAYVPKRKLGIEVGSSKDSLGFKDPGGVGYRTLSAVWNPSPEAWAAATWSDSLPVVRWLDHGDSLEMSVGSNGLPAAVKLTRPGSGAVTARYRGWLAVEGVEWPAVVIFEDDAGTLSVSYRIQRLRFDSHLDRERLWLHLPAEAERLTPSDLKRMLERLGEL